MEKRYEGFLGTNGLFVLDTFTGEVKFVSINGNIENKIELSVQENGLINQKTNKLENKILNSLEQEIISSYPFLIARPFHDLLNEVDPRMKCKLMVDTFTATLKYMALQLASEYIKASELKDVQIHQTLIKDLSRPLISAWNLLIARSLPVFKDHGVPLFSPEIQMAYEKLESKCTDPFLVTQSYSDENGNLKNKIKKLGKIQALINYRNGLAHGFNQSKERGQREFEEYYPLLCDILKEVRYMSRYSLWHVESNKEGVNGIRLMGSNPSYQKAEFNRNELNPAISPLFIFNDSTGEILPLYAFFDVEQTTEVGLPEMGKDIFVFEGNTKNSVIYLSSSGEYMEKTTRFQHWKDLLAQKQLDVEWVDEKKLSLKILNSISKYISNTTIQTLINSGKYLRETTVQRYDLNEYLDSFSDSTYNGFVLGGESGIGKSTLLAQKTELWQNEGHMVILYRGSALNQSDISNKFLRDCALKVNYLEDFLSMADDVFTKEKKNCYLIIDALNEFSGNINDLIRSVENTIAQATNYKWFKVIVSIRDSVYSRTSSKFGEIAPHQYFKIEEEKGGEKISTNLIKLKAIEKDFTEQLYDSYRNFKWTDPGISEDEGIYKFRPLTTFSELDPTGTTVELLRNPLMTRLILQSFHRSKLSSQLKNDEAMRLYLDNIILEKSNDFVGFPERLKLLNLFIRELDKQNTERLERDQLIKMDNFKPYLLNIQNESPYIQLLSLGVLMEEWEKDDCYIRFAFDRFFEFMLADLYYSKVNDANEIIQLCKRIPSFKILQGAIETIVLRFCNNNQPHILIEFSDYSNHESQEIQKFSSDIIARILYSISIENKDQFESIIKLFPENPSLIDLQILTELVDKFYITGNLTLFSTTMHIAQTEANSLEDYKSLSDLMLFDAQLDVLQGRYIQAREKFEFIKDKKSEITDTIGLCKTLIEFGKFEKLEHNTELALKYHYQALEIATLSKNELLKADAINAIATIYKDVYEDLKEAERLYDESLEISRIIGDKTGIAKILNNKSNIYKKQGKYKEAELMYIESLTILKQLGDKKRIGLVLSNIGMLKIELRNYNEAEQALLESLEIVRKLDAQKSISTVLNNLGKLYQILGRQKDSENNHIESLEIRRQLGDKKGIIWCLNKLGILNFEKGNHQSTRNYYLEAINIAIELNDIEDIIGTIHRLISILDSKERNEYYVYAKSLLDKNTKQDQISQIANIELSMYCLTNDKIEVQILEDKIQNVLIEKEKSKLKNIDNLPIEALYLSVNKLIEIGEKELAKKISNLGLLIIGDLKSFRKEYFLEILKIS